MFFVNFKQRINKLSLLRLLPLLLSLLHNYYYYEYYYYYYYVIIIIISINYCSFVISLLIFW